MSAQTKPEPRHRWERIPELILAAVGLGIGVELAFITWRNASLSGGRSVGLPDIPTGLLALLGIAASTYVVSKVVGASRQADAELESVRAERKDIEQRIEKREGGGLDIFGVIRLGLNQITEYYTINKSQARNSFTASMIAVIVGFGLLCLGILLGYDHSEAKEVAILSAVSGVLLQFIGGAYFYLYNRSLQQLNFFYETLVRLQDTMLAIQQVDLLAESGREKARESVIKALIRAPVSAPRIAEPASKGKGRRGKTEAGAAAAAA